MSYHALEVSILGKWTFHAIGTSCKAVEKEVGDLVVVGDLLEIGTNVYLLVLEGTDRHHCLQVHVPPMYQG